MAKDKAFIPNALRVWIEARRCFHLSHAHIQMARALGMNPKTFGKLANHRQEPCHCRSLLKISISGVSAN